MWLRIVDIDFDDGRVHVEVAPDESEDYFARLNSFVSRCASEGLADVRLYCRKGISKRNTLRLKNFAAIKQLAPLAALPPKTDDKGGYSAFFRSELPRRGSDAKETGPWIRYQIKVDDLAHAAERLNKAIALIGESEELDARSTLQLRLFVYELTMNTVEHGTFESGSPSICLGLLFSQERVSVTYRENAAVFLTSSRTSVNLVEEQINTNSKRGLGLYMLNRMCSDFHYERTGDWNISSFSVEIKREQVSTTKR
jgi:anti-sigma regulatory factor (Ser/Thr protein kinase)